MDEPSNLKTLDYLMISLVLATFAACGIFFNRRDKSDNTIKNFLLGNKLMSILPVAISVVATRYSAIGMTGGVGEVYSYGVEFTIAKYASAIGNVLAAFLIVPVFQGIDYVSMYEYMERRFSRVLRLLFACIYLIGETLYMSLVLYVPAISLSTLTGISLWVSVFGSGFVCIFYSALGGTKAVIWTDVLQTILMISCFIIIIVKGTVDVGGPSNVWDLAVKGQRVTSFTLSEALDSRYSVWSLIVDGIVMSIATLVTKQAVVQRFLSVKGKSEAKRATLLSALVTALFAVLVGAAGVVIYACYSHCDPITDSTNKQISSADQLLVYFTSKSLHLIPGLQGLAIAGLFSGSLSTMSSFINSFAAITVEDFIKIANPNLLSNETKSVYACKILTIVYGLIVIGLTFIVPQLGGVIKMSNIIKGATVGPLFGILLLGIFVRKANNKGAMSGLIIGLTLNLLLIFGSKTIKKENASLPMSTEDCDSQQFEQLEWTELKNSNQTFLSTKLTESELTHLNASNAFDARKYNVNVTTEKPVQSDDRYTFPLYHISFMWFGPIAVLTTFLIGLLVSLLTGGNSGVDDRLFSPVIQKFNKHHPNDAMRSDQQK